MKKIIPAINSLQLACMTMDHTANQKLGQARKDLMAAIREAITEGASAATKDTIASYPLPEHITASKGTSLLEQYLAKFDKLNGD